MNREEKKQVDKEHGNPKLKLPLTVWITTNCGKFERDGNTRPADLPLEKSVCKSGSNSQKWTGSKLAKEYFKAAYCLSAHLTYMHHEKCWAEVRRNWNQDWQEKYQ